MAIALGREAIRQRYSALFTTAQALMAALVKAHSADRLDDRLTFYANQDGGAWTLPMCGRMAGEVSGRRVNGDPTRPTFVG